MNLTEATGLLGPQARYFSEVYKLYNYRDDQLLKDYLDFIIHEPLEWLKGFPSKLTQKGSFSRPKAAVIKLLKHTNVIEALGETYTRRVYEVIWSTFKQNIDAILLSRQRRGASIIEQIESDTPDGISLASQDAPQLTIHETEGDEAESVHSVRLPKRMGVDWEKKYRVLEAAYIELIKEGPGASALTLLSALTTA